MFVRGAPVCQGNTRAELRAWHTAFTQFPAPKGKCVHPHLCFQKEQIVSIRGFSAGEDDKFVKHDLPSRHAMSLVTQSQQTCNVLSTNEVFPSGTCDARINTVKSHSGGHRCEALSGIMQSGHPACHPRPTTGVRDPPGQWSGEPPSSCFC